MLYARLNDDEKHAAPREPLPWRVRRPPAPLRAHVRRAAYIAGPAAEHDAAAVARDAPVAEQNANAAAANHAVEIRAPSPAQRLILVQQASCVSVIQIVVLALIVVLCSSVIYSSSLPGPALIVGYVAVGCAAAGILVGRFVLGGFASRDISVIRVTEV
jgi:hypothetical protein